MPASPLVTLQQQAGATFTQAFGWRLPANYSSFAEEYEAATQGAGLLDRTYVGRLEVAGRDGLDLLNRLSTNNLTLLTAPGQGMPTVLTSNKGRILDLLLVLRLDDHLLVMTGPENQQKVADWIDFYTFTEDVTVQDVTEETAMLAVVGPAAASLLDELTGREVSSLAPWASTTATIGSIEVLVLRADFAALPGYSITVPAAGAPQLWQALAGCSTGPGIKPVGLDAWEVIRIEQGIPVYGRELGEEVNPLEANLLELISFDKGCYVGQEVVARLNTYKKVQKHLVGLSWADDVSPAPKASLLLEGNRVGEITSAARSPRLNKGIGLGYVRNACARPGVQLAMESAGSKACAQVESLPFRP